MQFEATIDLTDCYVCDCSICRRKGSVMNRITVGDFKILSGKDEMTIYKFNTNIANHYFCTRCGIQTFHNPRSAPDVWSVNVRCIEDVELQSLAVRQVHGSKLK